MVHDAVVPVSVVGAPHVNPVPGVADLMVGTVMPPLESVTVITEVLSWL